MHRFWLPLLLGTLLLCTVESTARAGDCLDPSGDKFVILNFAAENSIGARQIGNVIGGKSEWIIRHCDQPRLLEQILNANALDQLLNRRIVVAIWEENAQFALHVIPYLQLHAKESHVPLAPAFGECDESLDKLAGVIDALLIAAADLYRFMFDDPKSILANENGPDRCKDVADRLEPLQNAIASLSELEPEPAATAKPFRPANASYLTVSERQARSRSTDLAKALEPLLLALRNKKEDVFLKLGCPPRPVNVRVLSDRRQRKTTGRGARSNSNDWGQPR